MKNDKKVKKEKQENIVISKKSLKKFLFKLIPILILIVIILPITNNIIKNLQEGKLYNVRSKRHLEKLVGKKEKMPFPFVFLSTFITSPFLYDFLYYNDTLTKSSASPGTNSITVPAAITDSAALISFEKSSSVSPSNDYSKTNVQVENIDEADVIKTDGGYVYSISDSSVVITEVLDKQNPKVLSKINSNSSTYPMEILINDNKLIIISTSVDNWRRNVLSETFINVYDITQKSDPRRLKTVSLNSKYNTSRVINNKVYIFTSQDISYEKIREDARKYSEDFKQKEIAFNKIKYLKNQKTSKLTTFVSFDLNEISKDVAISSYLVDMDTAYVSYENFYIFSKDYKYRDEIPVFNQIKSIFGFKGIFGIKDMYGSKDWNWRDRTTKIAKYQFTANGEIEFVENAKLNGKILNQYSCDEKDGNLRIALNNSEGTRIVVLDKDLKEIGDTGPVAPGEDNKSVRFTGNKAYFVTYKQVDPLYVIDLSNPRNPTIMGELKIPGFSNYLHPYDDNHIIGIGMATNENIVKDEFGRPIRENITFNGMKMTMFDISDVRNPKEKDVVYFGDRSTDSQINKNAKALLFSKEKNLIAIPISNMSNSNPIWNDMTKYGTNKNPIVQEKVKEGYIVYNITIDGFKYKGIITHDGTKYNNTNTSTNYYYNSRDPIRGLYIDNYLITVSNALLKINDLNTLQFISNIDLLKSDIQVEEIGKTFTFNDKVEKGKLEENQENKIENKQQNNVINQDNINKGSDNVIQPNPIFEPILEPQLER